MNFVPIKYIGRKDYRDRTSLRQSWQPGDTKLVPEQDAKKLLQFAEFEHSKAKVNPAELEQAKTAQKVADQAKQDAKRDLENVQVSIDQMDKDALEAYAKNYSVDLDKRRSLASLRQEVNNLIELHGAV